MNRSLFNMMHSLSRTVVLVLGSMFSCFIMMNESSASIEWPGMPEFANPSDMSGCIESSGAANRDEDSEKQRQDSPEFLSSQFALQPSPLSGGSTGTTSASNAGGFTCFAVDHRASNFLAPDTTVLSWLTSGQRLQLPDPPGNELLRPPRAV